MPVPASGANFLVSAASTVAPGNYSILVNGTAGGSSAKAEVAAQVIAGSPSPAYFVQPLFREITVAPGHSASTQMTISGSSLFSVSLSISGLPTGTSATFSPQIVKPGDSFTLTIAAASNAPVSQNAEVTITGTPGAAVPAATLTIVLDVTAANSSAGWNNRTDYTSTRATPFEAAYDPVHHMVYASNQQWNRIDIISDETHKLVKALPVIDPWGVDISIDGKTVWVATGSQIMYGIDTASLTMTRFMLPPIPPGGFDVGGPWHGYRILSLADGTVMLQYSSSSPSVGIWNPKTNTITDVSAPAGGIAAWTMLMRSGNGAKVFSVGDNSDETCFSYDVWSKTVSPALQLSGYGRSLVVSPDGSKVAISDVSGFNLYDANFSRIGPLPGDGGWFRYQTSAFVFGGSVFSPDGTTLYEETLGDYIPLIVSIDVATQQPVALAPAMPITPVWVEMSPPYYVPIPVAVDDSGMLVGIQYHGISFDDALATTNFVTNQPGTPTYMQHMNQYGGPVGAATTTSGFGNAFAAAPDVYYGGVKGSATVDSAGTIQITSPRSTTPGPVDVKMLFPDGTEVYDPQFFTFGTQIQDLILSGGAPQGGAPSEVDAFGLPVDPTGDQVTIGSNRAAVTSVPTQYPPFEGEQSAMYLSFNAPAGSPGWQDVTVRTPNGSGTMPKSFFYAKSVKDYPTSDAPTFVLYDEHRNQVYLSEGDHIDVFSLSANSFGTPLTPPAAGNNKQFEGLALSVDGKYLLATDLVDGSLAVIDPDAPSNAFVINIAPAATPAPGACIVGPLFVAADNLNQAFVVTGGPVGVNGCGPGGAIYVADLASHTAGPVKFSGCTYLTSWNSGTYVSATRDGSEVAFPGFTLYSAATNTCTVASPQYQSQGITAAGDGNLFASQHALFDGSGNPTGTMGVPFIYTNNIYNGGNDVALQNPMLNDTGSLYYWPHASYVDIVDVSHGVPALRFSLTEKVQNVVSPMAIDTSGDKIFLLTDRGLTVVDLGAAPLSIGHLTPAAGAVGASITVRGSGFASGISASVGGVTATVSFVDSETITVILPVANSGPEDLVLTNPDGKTYTMEQGIVIN